VIDSGLPVGVSGVSRAIKVSVGSSHSCALLRNKTVTCWGLNASGQLGNDTMDDSLVPVAVFSLLNVTDIQAGSAHNCALLGDQTMQCWGFNGGAQLGNQVTINSAKPVAVLGVASVTSITAGTDHTCVVLTSGIAQCWGSGGAGRLGSGNGASSNSPVDVVNLASATSIAASSENTCALLEDGSAKCWGSRQFGQVGDGTIARPVASAVDVLNVAGAKQISAGQNHFCVMLDDDETVQCWGENKYGQTGYGIVGLSATPLDIPNLNAVEQLASGGSHTCSRQSDNSMRCWGRPQIGALGNGSTFNSDEIVTVSAIDSAVDIAAGFNHSCSVLANGTARCWGAGFSGQIGNGANSAIVFMPAEVSGLTEATVIATGASHSCAIVKPADTMVAQSVMCWGSGAVGKLGNGASTNSNVPVTVSDLSTPGSSLSLGNSHTCVTRSGNWVSCWGANGMGQLGNSQTTNSDVPVDIFSLTEIAQLSLGGVPSCARVTNGTIKCWGSNSSGALGNTSAGEFSSTPVLVENVSTAIFLDAGSDHNCVVIERGGFEWREH
jgi:alpha-tubulin suppressor-like RCC1 family protein